MVYIITKAWNKQSIDILVHAQPHSSGSLLRLLNSLKRADYFGFSPGLTIELPYEVDPSLIRQLGSFEWPPNTGKSKFILRRRLQIGALTPQEASQRAVDSFYPHDPASSHVLVLSPDATIAPSFFHFLTYSLLRYKYSADTGSEVNRLFGISLELPSTRPTDGSVFSPPLKTNREGQTEQRVDPLFTWQMPNSNAALYFGDKWVQLHSFLFNRFTKSSKSYMHPNLFLKKYPAWMEYVLELLRVRGYYLLYPSFASEPDLNLVTVHNDLHQLPEEYRSPPKAPSQHTDKPNRVDIDGTSGDRFPVSDPSERDSSESSTISTLIRKFSMDLPSLSAMDVQPCFDKEDNSKTLVERTDGYAKTFKKEVGGCSEGQKAPEVTDLSADDLFCW